MNCYRLAIILLVRAFDRCWEEFNRLVTCFFVLRDKNGRADFGPLRCRTSLDASANVYRPCGVMGRLVHIKASKSCQASLVNLESKLSLNDWML
jgi:hypothetical protein